MGTIQPFGSYANFKSNYAGQTREMLLPQYDRNDISPVEKPVQTGRNRFKPVSFYGFRTMCIVWAGFRFYSVFG